MKHQPKIVELVVPNTGERVPLIRPHDPLRAQATFFFGIPLGLFSGYLLGQANMPRQPVALFVALCILAFLCCGGMAYWLWRRQDRNVRRLVDEVEEREGKGKEAKP